MRNISDMSRTEEVSQLERSPKKAEFWNIDLVLVTPERSGASVAL